MLLSDVDRENIEVLEAVSVNENALFTLLCQYFAYRKKSRDRQSLSPDYALQKTIKDSIENRTPARLIDAKKLEAIKDVTK